MAATHERLEIVNDHAGVSHLAYPTGLRTLCVEPRDGMVYATGRQHTQPTCARCAELLDTFAVKFPGHLPLETWGG